MASIQQTIPNASITVLPLDLASLQSVQQCANTFNETSDRLDILILNAGIAGVAPGLTKEGYEMHFGTNYLGHAFLAQLLLPKMLHTKRHDPLADLRIHVTASQAAVQWAPGQGLALSYMRDPSPRLWRHAALRPLQTRQFAIHAQVRAGVSLHSCHGVASWGCQDGDLGQGGWIEDADVAQTNLWARECDG